MISGEGEFVEPANRAAHTFHTRLPAPHARRRWDHPRPPSAAPSVDGVASSAPRVVLVPVDDETHGMCPLGGSSRPTGRRAAHLLHVVPAVHASTAMAYGAPPVWMEDLSTFSQSLYAVTIPSDPPHAPRYPPHFWLFLGRPRRGFLSLVTNALTDAHLLDAASQPYHASMATPGPTFWQQVEANERARHAEDAAPPEAFIAAAGPAARANNVKHVVDASAAIPTTGASARSSATTRRCFARRAWSWRRTARGA